MSIARMNAVWQDSKHKSSALILMLALADIADDLGVAWPGYEHLAWKTRMSRRTVTRIVAKCTESGELWMMNRSRQRSNVYIITIGLSLEELEHAANRASKLGALPPTGSAILTPPPQVLDVIARPGRAQERTRVVMPQTPSSATVMTPPHATAMTPEPPIPVINHQRTVIEPPATPAVDGDVLEKLQQIGVNGKKASELILSYTENGELGLLVPRLSEWIIHLDKQANVTSPIGLAITKTAERMDPPDSGDNYWRDVVKRQNRQRRHERGVSIICPNCSQSPCMCEEYATATED